MNVLQISISAGLIIAVIVIIRAVALNKIPKTTFLILWGVVMLRLLIPVPISMPAQLNINIYDIAGEIMKIPAENIPTPVISETNRVSNNVINSTEQTVPLATIVWIAGIIAMVIYFAVIYFKNYRELRFALPIDKNMFTDELLYVKNIKILQSDKLTTPVAAGIIKPRIILPKSMDMNDKQLLQYVLAHEYCHIKRFDSVWKLLMITVLCIHWFNPMVWVMFILASRDLEITCDEMVIRRFGAETKKSYAYAILKIAEQRAKFSPLYNGFSKTAAEERIKSIVKYKKSSVLTIILSVFLVLGLTAMLAAFTGIEEEKVILEDADIPVEDTSLDLTQESGRTIEDNTKTEREWFTYEEYSAWLEEYKIELQEAVGTMFYGWTNGGEYEPFVLTQEVADSEIAASEAILEGIKNGTMGMAKPADGVWIGYGLN